MIIFPHNYNILKMSSITNMLNKIDEISKDLKDEDYKYLLEELKKVKEKNEELENNNVEMLQKQLCLSTDNNRYLYSNCSGIINLDTIIIPILSSNCNIKIFTDVKQHNFEFNIDNDFILEYIDYEIVDIKILNKINKYIIENSDRSYFYEGIDKINDKEYRIMWGS